MGWLSGLVNTTTGGALDKMGNVVKQGVEVVQANRELETDATRAARKAKKEAEDLNAQMTHMLQVQAEEAARRAAAELKARQEEEARVAAVKQQLVNQSNKFEKDKYGQAQNLMAVAGEDARLQSYQGRGEVLRNARSRGLLNSGMKEQAIAAVRDNASQNLMAQQQAINDDIEAQSQAYKQMAREGINANQDLIFGNMASQQQTVLNRYQQGLQARRARLQGMSGVRSLLNSNQQVDNAKRNYDFGNQESYNSVPYEQIGGALGTGARLYQTYKDNQKTNTTGLA